MSTVQEPALVAPWALSHLGPFPATSATAPACHCPHRLPQQPCLEEVSAVGKLIIPSSALCCPGHKSLAVTGEGRGFAFNWGGSLQILTLALPAPFADNPSAATKSKTSEDIAQSSKYSPAYSPDPYYHSESEYWSFQSSPKGNKCPWGWEDRKHVPASKLSGREPCSELGLDTKVGLG